MTMALCFNCGNIKFGALTSCDECGYDPNNELLRDVSIRFSDWFLNDDDFNLYSSVIKQIHLSCHENDLCLWTFLRFMSVNYPSILSVDMSVDLVIQSDEILKTVNIVNP